MPIVLTINGGSSSIRFAFYDSGASSDCAPPRKLLSGKMDRIGLPQTHLSFEEGSSSGHVEVDAKDSNAAVHYLIDWLELQAPFKQLAGVGHRVVHGMQHSAPERLTAELVTELKQMIPYDPEHLPRELELIDAFRGRHAQLPQVVCFDTAFHRTMPRVATQLPIPRRYEKQGVQRYGFHGLSYTYLMSELRRLGDPAATRGRIVLAHLGNGASMAAVRDGKSIDTSMGFTSTAGLVMSTRTGDLDPGLMSYLAMTESMNAKDFQALVNHESGLLGISEISSDIRDLLEKESSDIRAAEAVAIFCYQARKWIGAFAAALNGVDLLVFAGGIGENSSIIRSRICGQLGFLGIELDEARNLDDAPIISHDSAAVRVRVIRTDEESVIAASTIDVLHLNHR